MDQELTLKVDLITTLLDTLFSGTSVMHLMNDEILTCDLEGPGVFFYDSYDMGDNIAYNNLIVNSGITSN